MRSVNSNQNTKNITQFKQLLRFSNLGTSQMPLKLSAVFCCRSAVFLLSFCLKCVCMCVCACVVMYADKKRKQEIYSHRLFVKNGPKWNVCKFQEKKDPNVRAEPLFVQWVIFPRKSCYPGNCVQRNFWFEKISWTFKVFRTLSEEIFDSEREKFSRVVKSAF